MEAVTALRMPPFHRYRNESGHSGVVGYSIVPDGIAVQFVDGNVYLYTYDVPGRRHVGRMKALAREGRGLGTYIGRHVGNRFATRLGRDEIIPISLRPQSSTRQNTAFR
ncbi:hypothetical protein [Cognatiluteimonas telluris]|uniref:hypothetical protein n=1 Tax=Cognatiluteimonas telluris TaxID=1104775 RepID=UPI001A9CA510|nr:hypothetical protein [Lysobacter telluris]